MDELCEPFGLVLPVEARRWYSWHDGAEGVGAGLERSIGGWRPMPLRMALADIEETRRIDAEGQATLPADPIEGPPTPRHPSLGDLIDDWLDRLRSGDWRFDADTSRWHLLT